MLLELVAPAGSALHVRIRHHGNVEVRGLQGDIEIEQFQGRIALYEVPGPALAHIARDGDIRVRFSESPAPRPMAFSTYDGDLHIEIPESAASRLQISTIEGSMYSDMPPRGTGSPSRNAGPRITVRNARGEIHVRALR